MHNLKEIKVWQKSIGLTIELYAILSNFPTEEKYGLISQIKRSGISISSNIAEGAGRNSNKEFIHFLGIANGSSYELQTQIIIASNLNLIDQIISESLLNKIDEIQKMIYGFINKLNDN